MSCTQWVVLPAPRQSPVCLYTACALSCSAALPGADSIGTVSCGMYPAYHSGGIVSCISAEVTAWCCQHGNFCRPSQVHSSADHLHGAAICPAGSPQHVGHVLQLVTVADVCPAAQAVLALQLVLPLVEPGKCPAPCTLPVHCPAAQHCLVLTAWHVLSHRLWHSLCRSSASLCELVLPACHAASMPWHASCGLC